MSSSQARKSPEVDPQYNVGGGRDFALAEVRLLVAMLNQAIEDALDKPIDNELKYEATEWLCDEDNKLLQLCLFLANMDHDRILAKIARHGWNLNL
jgi:hypothetical protein